MKTGEANDIFVRAEHGLDEAVQAHDLVTKLANGLSQIATAHQAKEVTVVRSTKERKPGASHSVPAEIFQEAVNRLVTEADNTLDELAALNRLERSERVLEAVQELDYGPEYEATAKLLGISKGRGLDPDYFYQYERGIPFCIVFALHDLERTEAMPIETRIGVIAKKPIAVALAYAEAMANAADGTGREEALKTMDYLRPLLPAVEMPV